MDLLTTGLTIIILLALSGFFSMSETALTSVSRPKMLGLSQEGNRRAVIINKLLLKQDKLISTLLLGNNLINILASAIATEFMLDAFGSKGIAIATALMTVLVLLFAEVLPKAYALSQADKVSLRIAPVVRAIYWLLWPPTWVVSWIVRRVARFLGADISKVQGAISQEELRGAIEMHIGEDGERSETAKHERIMLRSILDLADVTVEKVMTHRSNIDMLDASMPAGKLVDAVLASPYTRIPLYQEHPDNIVGVLQTRFLMTQIRMAKGDDSAIDFMAAVTEPWFIPETTTLFNQLQEFRDRKEQFALVVDEYGALLGLVTREDILEEIVGNMDEQSGPTSEEVKPHEDSTVSYVIDGSTTIRELNREFEWNLPDEDYATVAGLILYESQVIPQVGQSFVFYGFEFDVLARQRNQITSVRITKLEKPGAR